MITAIPAAQGVDADGSTGPHTGTGPDAAVIARLDEVPGVGARATQIIIAEIGLDMSSFPTPGHLASWAKLCPRANQSGAKNRPGANQQGQPSKGNPYLKGVLGEVAAAAAKTNTFLGQRYRRLVKRCGKLKALVARGPIHPGHHLAPAIRPRVPLPRPRPQLLRQPLGPEKTKRNRMRQLEALGYRVTLEPAA